MFWIPKTMRLIPRSPNEFTNTSKVEKRWSNRERRAILFLFFSYLFWMDTR
jgi:hypothetical protein